MHFGLALAGINKGIHKMDHSETQKFLINQFGAKLWLP